MMDLQEKEPGLEISDGQMRSCSDCHTTRIPLWRGGPAGPKTLCNACGIKYNKKRRQVLGLEGRKQWSHINKKQKNKKSNEMGRSLKMRIVALGRELRLKKISQAKLGEEEKAAVLLMALSSGSYVLNSFEMTKDSVVENNLKKGDEANTKVKKRVKTKRLSQVKTPICFKKSFSKQKMKDLSQIKTPQALKKKSMVNPSKSVAPKKAKK